MSSPNATTNHSSYGSAGMSDDEVIRHCAQFIRCESCDNGNATLRCSRCHLVHYCSRECQAKDWKQKHKSICAPVAALKKKAASVQDKSDASARLKTMETMRRQVLEAQPKCSICFEQPMVQPIVLEKCHHAFCFRCLHDWNTVNERKTRLGVGLIHFTFSCPVCRQEISNIAETMNFEIILLLFSAEEGNPPESFVQEQCVKALEKMELMKEINEMEKDPGIAEQYHHQFLYYLYTVHKLQKDYDKAFKFVRESEEKLRVGVQAASAIEAMQDQLQSLQLDSEADDDAINDLEYDIALLLSMPFTLPKFYIQGVLQTAQIQVLQEDWIGVKSTLMNSLFMYGKDDPSSPGMVDEQLLEIFMTLSQCFYHLGEYESAIRFGLDAIEINRHFKGSHKYITLAYLATSSSPHREAQQCAAEAVIYEVPWDRHHRAIATNFYREHFLR
jgi:tetratricopeptide (TPR) repeat protein